MIDQPFPELKVGQSKVSRGRTLTETDVVNFCMLTGNWLEIHANEEFAKTARFGRRVVQGSLVFSIVNALLPFDSSVVDAFYGVDLLRFLKPTFICDTLWARSEIIDLREKDGDAGVATLELVGANQRREKVMRCEFSLLIRGARLLPLSNDPFTPAEPAAQ